MVKVNSLTQHTRVEVEQRLVVVQLFSHLPMDENVHCTELELLLLFTGDRDSRDLAGGELVNFL